MKIRKLYILLIFPLFFSCENFDFNDYQVNRNGDYQNLNQKAISRLKNEKKDTLRVALIGDSQRQYAATENTIQNINETQGIDFVIHTGDLVDFGLQNEYIWMHELLNTLISPYFPVVGNHDLIGNGEDIYRLMYGDLNYSFTYNQIKFIFINTCGREYGFDPHVPNIPWLDAELSDTANYQKAIVISHVGPYNADFNLELTDDYLKLLGKYNSVMLHVNGHNHNFAYSVPEEAGIPFINTFSTVKERFILLEIVNDEFTYRIIGP